MFGVVKLKTLLSVSETDRLNQNLKTRDWIYTHLHDMCHSGEWYMGAVRFLNLKSWLIATLWKSELSPIKSGNTRRYTCVFTRHIMWKNLLVCLIFCLLVKSRPGDAYMYASINWTMVGQDHDDVIKWKHFPCYWPFVRGIHRSPVNSPHKGQWRGALMPSLICVNKWLSKQSSDWWFETLSFPLWRHRNVMACHTFGAKPISEPMFVQEKLVINMQQFSITKMHSTMLSVNCRHFRFGGQWLKYNKLSIVTKIT